MGCVDGPGPRGRWGGCCGDGGCRPSPAHFRLVGPPPDQGFVLRLEGCAFYPPWSRPHVVVALEGVVSDPGAAALVVKAAMLLRGARGYGVGWSPWSCRRCGGQLSASLVVSEEESVLGCSTCPT